jgi:ubiquitin carboxyl-terminal hydrolase L3
LWELDGDRKGPICRGELGDAEDVLSEKGLELGLGRIMEVVKQGGGDVYFSCVAVTAEEES